MRVGCFLLFDVYPVSSWLVVFVFVACFCFLFAGTSSGVPGQSSAQACVPCAAGTYSAWPMSARCSECPAGSFMESTGWTGASCTACPASRPDSGSGSVSHLDCVASCAAGTFLDPLTGGCMNCSAGTYNPVAGGVGPSVCAHCPPGGLSVCVVCCMCLLIVLHVFVLCF